MIRVLTLMAVIVAALASTGCNISSNRNRFSASRVTEPPLSENMTTQELVDYINKQNEDLDGWRSTTTKMHVRLPNMIPQRLSGAIACQTPSYFRLTADNLVAKTDLGSNNHRCWAYVQPGESAVMTWKHEDTPLLQQVSLGIPYIDPNWLMLVLGITPLDAGDYQIRPAEKQQLWLESIVGSPSGRPIRRVIKFDRVHHVVREHVIADSEANVLVRAVLTDHRWKNNRLIPHCVRLDFPQMKTEIRLTFRDIETNPHLPDSLWYLPDSDVEVVDIGEIIRHKMAAENPHLADQLLGRESMTPFDERGPLRAPLQNGNSFEQFPELTGSSPQQFADAGPRGALNPSVRLEEPQFGESEYVEQQNPFAESAQSSSDSDQEPLTLDYDFIGAGEDDIPEPEWSATSLSHTVQPATPLPRKRKLWNLLPRY